MINWSIEYPQIEKIAAEYAIDPLFIAAIRHTENGGPGRELGVLDARATTYEAQVREACATVRNRLQAYPGNPLDQLQGPKVARLIYRKDFIAWFARSWAPPGAENDPTNLNANWPKNAATSYFSFVTLGRVQ